MGMIQVTATQVRAKAEEMQNLNAQFKAQTETLAAEEQGLGSMWEGQAKTAFHTAFTRDQSQMDEFHGLIGLYVQALLQIAAKYEQAEARNVELASGRTYA